MQYGVNFQEEIKVSAIWVTLGHCGAYAIMP